ncbi:MAG: hypothetical protein NVSMB1_23110 [Polyangiales bacterium]
MHRSIPLVCAALLSLSPACSSSDSSSKPGADSGTAGETTDPGPDLGGMKAELPCLDDIAAVYGAPGALPEGKGAIIKCALDRQITRDDLQKQLATLGYKGKPATSGARTYHVLYRTERGTQPPTPGYSSALVYLPITPRSTSKLPIVVASHGSEGQAAKCISSKGLPAGGIIDNYNAQVLPLIGAGFAVIAPDLAGYSNFGAQGNPPSAYAESDDVAKSTLDGARALARLIPSKVNNELVLVGHSQGGHTALSALALAESYASEFKIDGAVVYAPLWFSQATWGAIIALAGAYPIKAAPAANAVSIWFHYTQGELLDGKGGGLLPFQESKRAAIKAFVEGTCWKETYPELEAIGKDLNDVYDPVFADAVAIAAATGNACETTEPKKSICEKWIARYTADRPHLTGKAAAVPILLAYGGKDDTLAPDRMKCVVDRLRKDGANLTVCLDPDTDHGGIVRTKPDFANDWIASKTLGAPAPPACAKDEKGLVDAMGQPISCAQPPPND